MAIGKINFPECYQEFRDKLERLLNESGMDAHSHTPNYILADMLTSQLLHYDIAIARTRKSKQ